MRTYWKDVSEMMLWVFSCITATLGIPSASFVVHNHANSELVGTEPTSTTKLTCILSFSQGQQTHLRISRVLGTASFLSRQPCATQRPSVSHALTRIRTSDGAAGAAVATSQIDMPIEDLTNDEKARNYPGPERDLILSATFGEMVARWLRDGNEIG